MSDWTTIERRRVIDRDTASGLVGTPVTAKIDYEVIHEPTVVIDPDVGEPVLAYLPMAEADTANLTAAILKLTGWTSVARAENMRNLSRTFGMAPRRPAMKHDSCRITALARDNPREHQILADLSLTLGDTLRQFAPGIAARDELTISDVEDEWRMAHESHWTSGVVNHTAQLPYHRDGMNFDAWSAMPVIRRGVSGGYLHVPEYNLAPSCRNGFAVYFNGYQLVHGVTPFTNITKPSRHPERDGKYRFSVVYYALRGMKDCFTHAAELAQGQAARTGREDNQAAVVRGDKAWR